MKNKEFANALNAAIEREGFENVKATFFNEGKNYSYKNYLLDILKDVRYANVLQHSIQKEYDKFLENPNSFPENDRIWYKGNYCEDKDFANNQESCELFIRYHFRQSAQNKSDLALRLLSNICDTGKMNFIVFDEEKTNFMKSNKEISSENISYFLLSKDRIKILYEKDNIRSKLIEQEQEKKKEEEKKRKKDINPNLEGPSIHDGKLNIEALFEEMNLQCRNGKVTEHKQALEIFNNATKDLPKYKLKNISDQRPDGLRIKTYVHPKDEKNIIRYLVDSSENIIKVDTKNAKNFILPPIQKGKEVLFVSKCRENKHFFILGETGVSKLNEELKPNQSIYQKAKNVGHNLCGYISHSSYGYCIGKSTDENFAQKKATKAIDSIEMPLSV